MPKFWNLLSLGVAALAIVIGANYVRVAVGHHGLAHASVAAASISPTELTIAAGVLPVTLIDNYF